MHLSRRITISPETILNDSPKALPTAAPPLITYFEERLRAILAAKEGTAEPTSPRRDGTRHSTRSQTHLPINHTQAVFDSRAEMLLRTRGIQSESDERVSNDDGTMRIIVPAVVAFIIFICECVLTGAYCFCRAFPLALDNM